MLILDIETIPTDAALAAPYPEAARPAPANYKDPVKIAEWRERDQANWTTQRAKECSTNPLLGRVLAVALAGFSETAPAIVHYAEHPLDERAVIANTLDALASHRGEVCTWNGRGFDLRFILVRALALGITLPPNLIDAVGHWFRRYSTAPHLDLKALLCDGDEFSKEDLGVWSHFCGLNGKHEGMTGADVWPLYQAGQHQQIVDYARGDAMAIRALALRVAPVFGLSLGVAA